MRRASEEEWESIANALDQLFSCDIVRLIKDEILYVRP